MELFKERIATQSALSSRDGKGLKKKLPKAAVIVNEALTEIVAHQYQMRYEGDLRFQLRDTQCQIKENLKAVEPGKT